MAMRCGGFAPRGRGRRRSEIMSDFLAENPDCAEKMLRHGVAMMRDDDYAEDDIRAYLEDLHGCGHLDELDIDDILR